MKPWASSCRGASALLLIALLAAQASGAMITDIFVFGDSLSDTGNVLNRTKVFLFVADRPINPWYDTGRWTNGPSNTGSNEKPLKTKKTAIEGVWHEQLADKLKKAGILKTGRAKNSLDGGNNWAYGGATTGTGEFGNEPDLGVELKLQNVGEQVKQFLEKKPAIKDTQLFALWGGGNDLRDAAVAGGDKVVDNVKEAATKALANMKANIAALIEKGAKRFLWPNLPPLHKTPEALDMNAKQQEGLEKAAKQFHDEQAAAIAMLKKDKPGVTIDILNVYGEFLEIVGKKPPDFNIEKGVVNVTGGKFSNAAFGVTANFPDTQDTDTFLFWDQIHPTAKTHQLIAKEAFSLFAHCVPEPATGVLLFMALIVLGPPQRKQGRYVLESHTTLCSTSLRLVNLRLGESTHNK